MLFDLPIFVFSFCFLFFDKILLFILIYNYSYYNDFFIIITNLTGTSPFFGTLIRGGRRVPLSSYAFISIPQLMQLLQG